MVGDELIERLLDRFGELAHGWRYRRTNRDHVGNEYGEVLNDMEQIKSSSKFLDKC